MKRTSLPATFVAISLCCVSANAATVIYEPFAYPVGGLDGQGGTSDFGFTGNWSANGTSLVSATNLTYGSLSTTGGSIGGLSASQNRFGGARSVSASALAGNSLLNNGATLWFSVIVDYEDPSNNQRLSLALANNSFNTNNFQYNIPNEGPQTGAGVGFTLTGNSNGRVSATRFNNTVGNNGTQSAQSGIVVTNAGPPTLIVGSFTWGAGLTDVINIYAPDTDLNLGSVIASLTVDVDQATFDTITWARGDRILMDEIRFGASFADVAPVPAPIPEPSTALLGAVGALALFRRRRA